MRTYQNCEHGYYDLCNHIIGFPIQKDTLLGKMDELDYERQIEWNLLFCLLSTGEYLPQLENIPLYIDYIMEALIQGEDVLYKIVEESKNEVTTKVRSVFWDFWYERNGFYNNSFGVIPDAGRRSYLQYLGKIKEKVDNSNLDLLLSRYNILSKTKECRYRYIDFPRCCHLVSTRIGLDIWYFPDNKSQYWHQTSIQRFIELSQNPDFEVVDVCMDQGAMYVRNELDHVIELNGWVPLKYFDKISKAEEDSGFYNVILDI